MENWGFFVFICAVGAFAIAAYLMTGAARSKSTW
jgi:hypothetical protein